MKTLYVLIFLCALAGCTTKTVTSPSISEEKTKEVLDHHLAVFIQNDLEGTMADYTEESVLITPDASFIGLAEIRKNFEGAFAAFPKDSSTLTINKTVVVKDLGYILWQAKAPKFELSYATDTFVIQDGKIIRQTYAGVAK